MKTNSRGGTSADERVREAVALHRQGQRQKADRIYRQVLRAHPSHPDALHFSGLLAHQCGDDEAAVLRIRKAIEARPDYADAFKNLGNIMLGLDRFAEAEQCYLRVIELDSRDTTGWSNLGVARRYRRKFEEAIEAGETATRLGPEHPVAWYNLGNTYKVMGRFKQAIRCYHCATEIDPKFGPAHDGLCQSTLRMELRSRFGRRSLSKSIKAYERWLKCDPNNPIATFMLKALRGEEGFLRAPDEVIRTLFDQSAGNFERRLAQLEYRVPALIGDVLQERLGVSTGTLEVVDGGCGTGLCAPVLRPYAAHLVGVDLSEGMLERARKTGLYDHLYEAELTAWLEQNRERFDLAVFADTLCYFGDLAPVLGAAANALRRGGNLLFSVERAPKGYAGGGYGLHPHGRYSHKESYVCERLAQAGFDDIHCAPRTLRLELGHEVAGLMVWARRAAPLPNGQVEPGAAI